ncbi:MAG: phage terminase large subunit, partial [Pirellulales bacterium]|nr:phage terminase large subunit [Pirellulales bacterium]
DAPSQRAPNVCNDLTLLDWARQFLPHHFTRPSSSMHEWLEKHADDLYRDRRGRINLVGPRGHAKSTVITLAYVLRSALDLREPYTWIVSDTHSQAVRHLENVKAELTDNSAIQETYPHAAGKGPQWRAGRVKLANGAVIEAYGTGQRIRGRRHHEFRPTLIVCDDLENDGHMYSATQRQRVREWFDGTLLKAGTERTNVINLATALHPDSLAMRLRRTPGWTSANFRAICEWPDNQSLWQQWETLFSNAEDPDARRTAQEFYTCHRNAMDAGAVVLWPEYEDLYALMRMRAEGGRSAFEREKQGSPLNAETCEWPEEYFDEHIWFEHWPRGLVIRTLALDPSRGTDARRGDYSAFVMLGVDSSGVIFVEADLARRPIAQIVADGVELYRLHQPDAFGIEANQFQELLAPSFEEEFRRQGILGARPWSLENRVNKLVRIRRIGPYLAARRIRFKHDSPSTRMLVDQLRCFPNADHDDGPDAFEMAIRLAVETRRRSSFDDGLGDRLIAPSAQLS